MATICCILLSQQGFYIIKYLSIFSQVIRKQISQASTIILSSTFQIYNVINIDIKVINNIERAETIHNVKFPTSRRLKVKCLGRGEGYVSNWLVHELRKNRRRQTMRNWDGNHYINCNPRLYKGIDPAWSGKEGGGGFYQLCCWSSCVSHVCHPPVNIVSTIYSVVLLHYNVFELL